MAVYGLKARCHRPAVLLCGLRFWAVIRSSVAPDLAEFPHVRPENAIPPSALDRKGSLFVKRHRVCFDLEERWIAYIFAATSRAANPDGVPPAFAHRLLRALR